MNTSFAKRILSLCLFVAIAGGILYFMFRSVARDWPLIASYPWKIEWFSLTSSLVLSVISMLVAIKAAHRLCITLSGDISFVRFLYIYCIAQLGRYLPGRIWLLVGFTLLMEREGVKRTVAVIFPLLFQGLMVAVLWLTGVLMSGPLVISKLALPVALPATLSTAALVVALLLLPFLWRRAGHLIGSKFSEIKKVPLPEKGYFSTLGLLVITSLGLSGAFFLFVSSLIGVAGKGALTIGGIFLLSYVIGWVIFVVPGGLGVREGTLAFLLAAVVSPAVSNVVALAARLWMTAAECILLLGVWVWARFIKGEHVSIIRFDSGSNGSPA